MIHTLTNGPGRYELIISAGTLDYYLASRLNIGIEEATDFETLVTNDASCGGCGQLDNKEFKFKIHFIGNCSLATAWTIYNQFLTHLALSCGDPTAVPPVLPVELILRRRVFDEPYQTYKITKSLLRMVDTINQYVQRRILTMEWVITVSAWPPAGSGIIVTVP